ncbi:MAG TPA: cytochrome P450 [Microthrixaceae bacterium]|nr:cytochrome P450 [Microthrixaceae bacterium]
MSELGMTGGEPDLEALAHPQRGFKLMRDAGPVVDVGDERGIFVGGDTEVRHVLQRPDVFSSGIGAADIGQVRPLIPLQIDPPRHRDYRKLLDPIFAPKRIARLEESTRDLVRELIGSIADQGRGNVHAAVTEPLPTTVFLRLLGLPVSRAREFLDLKDGIIRPPVRTRAERSRYTAEVGARIYAVLQEAIDARTAQRSDDFLSMFLDAEVDGHRLTNDDVLDIGYLFFLAGLDTVTASLDCMIAYLAQHADQRRRLVEDPSLLPRAIEEMLRWESPVQAVVRVATRDTELAGCPVPEGRVVTAMLGSANTDERAWPDADTVDFGRAENRHLAFGGGAHRCLGSHLARMELRVALEEWHRAVPDYRIADGVELHYSPGLRAIDNLELAW